MGRAGCARLARQNAAEHAAEPLLQARSRGHARHKDEEEDCRQHNECRHAQAGHDARAKQGAKVVP
jgi:hypothetical protein